MLSLPLFVEHLQVVEDLSHALGRCHQVSDSEVVGAFFLTEPAAWYCHYTRFVYHVHAVQEVRLFALLFSLIDELLREVNSRESVHRSFDFSASDILHTVKRARK